MILQWSFIIFLQAMRVYYDRLVDVSDKAWLFDYLTQTVDKHLGAQFNTLFEALDSDQDGKVCVRFIFLHHIIC